MNWIKSWDLIVEQLNIERTKKKLKSNKNNIWFNQG
jgi:hypothetical protein